MIEVIFKVLLVWLVAEVEAEVVAEAEAETKKNNRKIEKVEFLFKVLMRINLKYKNLISLYSNNNLTVILIIKN